MRDWIVPSDEAWSDPASEHINRRVAYIESQTKRIRRSKIWDVPTIGVLGRGREIMFVDQLTDVLFPRELEQETGRMRAIYEPQCIGFQCFGCGGRHAEIDALIACHGMLEQFYANEIKRTTAEAEAVPALA